MAIALFVFSVTTYSHLPALRAHLSQPFHEHCLKSTPKFSNESDRRIQQALVCGRNLNDQNDEYRSWRELGLIHVLVVSGGHLSILAVFVQGILRHIFLLPFSRVAIPPRYLHLTVQALTLMIITWLAAANRFEPPVLRAWIDFLLRARLKQNGYQGQETSLISTWLALPSISTHSDLLSLALSFFASVLIEVVGQALHRRPWLAALCLQASLWWALLPLLLPLGLPHPVATLSNLLLAPIIGGVLIPMALGHFAFTQLDFTWLSHPFSWTWKLVHNLVRQLSDLTPDLAPRFQLSFFENSVAGFALLFLACALILRYRSRGRRPLTLQGAGVPLAIAFVLMTSGAWLHSAIRTESVITNEKRSLIDQAPSIVKRTTSASLKIKRDKVCIPYPTIERPARSKRCRRRHSSP